jgi:septal ring factor EnvC (AmiA/AmiB activator)
MRLGPRKLLAAVGVVLVAAAGWLAYRTGGTAGLLGVILAVVLATALAEGYLVAQLGRKVTAADRRMAVTNERLRETGDALRREQKRANQRQASLDGLAARLEELATERVELREALQRIDASLDELAGRVERPSEQAEGLLRAVNAGFRRLELEMGADRDGPSGR